MGQEYTASNSAAVVYSMDRKAQEVSTPSVDSLYLNRTSLLLTAKRHQKLTIVYMNC
jgi:hypothetical protein